MPIFLKRLPVYILFLLCCFNLYAQQTVALFYEKLYLHTDRDIYVQGDNIWFKAYLLNAQNNMPINYSHNLYVELIGPHFKISARETVRLENGLGNGDFKLPDTLSPGKYRIRAYTNWMRNFGDKFIFEKNITVVSASGAASVANTQKPVKRLKRKPNLAGIKDTLPAGPLVRFFPESGYLVNDVRSVVAVRAEDEFGRGIAVHGDVLASSGRKVAAFSCDSSGMATFSIRPDESQKYHAEVSIKGQLYNFKIANPLHKGFVLSVNTVPDVIVADISCNGFTLSESGGADVVIVGQHGGKTCYKQRVTINSKNSLVQIPDATFAEGIASITLFDEHVKPLGQRLVYVHHANYTKLAISTDKPVYRSKEKVTVTIKLSDTTRAHLSFAAVDAGLAPVQPGDIASYLNLRSEIKGGIEHPERYFDTTNLNRFKQLDMLLMTQGWRSFLWQRIADTIPNIKYEVEQSISLTGRVRKVFGNKPLAGMSITMFAPKASGQKLFSAVTDSLGRFTVDGAIFYGYQFINFTSRKANMMKDGQSKGKSGGWIQVDSLFQDKLPVYPAVADITDTILFNPDSLLAREAAKKKFSFNGDNQLKTVLIKGYTNKLPPEEHSIGQAEQKDYGSLMQYLLYMIPGAHIEEGGCNIYPEGSGITMPVLQFSYFPSKKVAISGIYADHSKIDYRSVCDDDYLEQPITNVYKVTIHRSMSVYGLNIFVMVILKPGVLEHTIFDNALADVTGYYKARQFFAPRYETPGDKPDYRTTIHWEPNITTNANGEATISFYNADPKNKIRLVVQGITDKGVPLVADGGYEVR